MLQYRYIHVCNICLSANFTSAKAIRNSSVLLIEDFRERASFSLPLSESLQSFTSRPNSGVENLYLIQTLTLTSHLKTSLLSHQFKVVVLPV